METVLYRMAREYSTVRYCIDRNEEGRAEQSRAEER
jgi:hypothetical protein